MPRVYMDYAATAPILPAAVDAMVDQMQTGGNPSSLHSAGRRARAAVEYAREQIARVAGCDSAEIIFTSGGTEADNLAVKGLFWKRREANPAATRLIVSAVEHHAVADAAEWLQTHEGADISWVYPDATGQVTADSVREAVGENPETVALIIVMWANNEVGTVQPVAELAALAAELEIPFHTDAVQAFGTLPVNFREVGATTMAISAHKMGGPMGIGALIATRSAQLMPVLHGGGQERSVRSGTVDAASIAGFGAAAAEVADHLTAEGERLATLRDKLVAGIRAVVPEAQLRGPVPESAEQRAAGHFTRLPGNAHFTFPGCEGDSLLFLLDMAGVESSTGSACNAGVPRPSHVLLAMGLSEEEARGAQRFTLGHTTTDEDIEAVLTALPGAWAQAKKAGMAGHAPDATRWN
ncbi:cysteine desulfurase [Rothia nasimurium]|uniref:Cysteine desulfurase n=1 Tax=Rothia nasimurium TaxID=85336 RepID=A0A1Y1RLM9_9MICC|nr:cysteine desulfurase family protein [Rothia nasimurium]ORC15284.1 cysteine desulfurase [Rothia nasimurium]